MYLHENNFTRNHTITEIHMDRQAPGGWLTSTLCIEAHDEDITSPNMSRCGKGVVETIVHIVLIFVVYSIHEGQKGVVSGIMCEKDATTAQGLDMTTMEPVADVERRAQIIDGFVGR